MFALTNERILVIAAHPDDEVLGAGGLMATYPGCSVAIASDGTEAEYSPEPYRDRRDARWLSAREAAKCLGSIIVREGDFIDQQMKLSRYLVEWTETIVREIRPTLVLTHNPTDLNSDHRVVTEAVAIATRPYARTGDGVRALLGFSVDTMPMPSLHQQCPQLLLELSAKALEMKLEALSCYASQMRDWPHPRSYKAIEYQARWLGATVGISAAEPYTLIWGVMG